jgi:hypothetical protein
MLLRAKKLQWKIAYACKSGQSLYIMSLQKCGNAAGDFKKLTTKIGLRSLKGTLTRDFRPLVFS